MFRHSRRWSSFSALCLVLLLAGPVSPARAATNETRIASLTRASSDPGLAPWQREFYRQRLDALRAGTLPDPGSMAARVATNLPATPVWSRIAETPRRQGHSMVLDTLSGRLYVFGGTDDADVSNEVFVIDPDGAQEWHALRPVGIPPAARMAHVAVFDGANRRMLMYGGTDADGSYLDDLWALNLDGVPSWTQLAPAGSPPPARANHFAVVDSPNHRMLAYGGSNGGLTALTDLWQLSLGDTPAWSQVVPGAGISGTFTPSAAMLDERHRRFVLAGTDTVGYTTSITLNFLPLDSATPTWTSWATSFAYTPSTSYPAEFAIDYTGDRLICLSEYDNSQVYTLPIAGASQWTAYSVTGAAQPYRYGRSIAIDTRHRRLFVQGGSASYYASSSGGSVSDLAALDLAGASRWTAVASDPAGRSGHSLAFDAARGIVHMFGGVTDSTGGGSNALSNQLWSIVSGVSEPTWTPEAATGGPIVPRAGASLIVDPVRDRLVLFGGTTTSAMTNEVWQRPLSGGTAWAPMTIAGTLPHERAYHPAVYDPIGDRMLVFGGYGGGQNELGLLGDLWALSLGSTPRWTRLVPTGTSPSARETAVFTFDPVHECAYLVGGYNGSYYTSSDVRPGEVWKLTFSPTLAWERIANGSPRSSYYDDFNGAVFYDVDQGALMRVSSPYDQASAVVSTLIPGADTLWTVLPTAGASPRSSSSAIGVFDDRARRVVWFGGTSAAELGTWVLSLGVPPLAVPPSGEPVARAMSVFPNPAHGRVGVRFALGSAGKVRLELLDLSGRRVRGPVAADCQAGPGELAIDGVGSLPAGVYFARLSGALSQRARVAIIH